MRRHVYSSSSSSSDRLMISQRGNEETCLFLLFFFLFLVIFIFSRGLTTVILLSLGSLWVAGLLARPLAEPLGQPALGLLGPVVELLLPDGLEHLGAHNLPAALVQLLPVAIGPGVCAALVLGEHPDLGRVLAGEGLGVETLLEGLVPQLDLLPLLQLLEFVVLGQLALLVVVLVGLQGVDGLPQLVGLAPQLVRVHGVEVEGLDADAQRDLHLLLDLLLGLGHLTPGVKGGGGLLLATLLLLGGHHLLALALGLLEPLLLLLLAEPVLLLLLLLGQLLLLLVPDLLPLGLLLLHALELLFLLGALLPPLVDVLL